MASNHGHKDEAGVCSSMVLTESQRLAGTEAVARVAVAFDFKDLKDKHVHT